MRRPRKKTPFRKILSTGRKQSEGSEVPLWDEWPVGSRPAERTESSSIARAEGNVTNATEVYQETPYSYLRPLARPSRSSLPDLAFEWQDSVIFHPTTPGHSLSSLGSQDTYPSWPESPHRYSPSTPEPPSSSRLPELAADIKKLSFQLERAAGADLSESQTCNLSSSEIWEPEKNALRAKDTQSEPRRRKSFTTSKRTSRASSGTELVVKEEQCKASQPDQVIAENIPFTSSFRATDLPNSTSHSSSRNGSLDHQGRTDEGGGASTTSFHDRLKTSKGFQRAVMGIQGFIVRMLRTTCYIVFQPLDILRQIYGPESERLENMVRIRWTCFNIFWAYANSNVQKCGQALYDDYIETGPGAALRLEKLLNRPQERPSGSDSSSNTANGSSQQAQSSATSFAGDVSLAMPDGQSIMDNSRQSCVNRPPYAGPKGPSSMTETLWLLTCANEDKFTPKLTQLEMDPAKVESDKALALALKNQYSQTRQKWWQILRVWGLTTIRFVQFEVHLTGVVDIRKCPDIPPSYLTSTYLFEPSDLIPPVGEHYLMHLFQHPEDYEEELVTYHRMPKKRGERLRVSKERGVKIGWGIHLVEGFLIGKASSLLVGFFVFASVVFGIVWSVKRKDVQAAWGVSAWICGMAALLIVWCQTNLG
ncbi:MAG: hypothetical protein M1836_001134 [Candelina mexicana]|nr:MAG: hypothetical protein M1836_001134 [Candelina mexicana]